MNFSIRAQSIDRVAHESLHYVVRYYPKSSNLWIILYSSLAILGKKRHFCTARERQPYTVRESRVFGKGTTAFCRKEAKLRAPASRAAQMNRSAFPPRVFVRTTPWLHPTLASATAPLDIPQRPSGSKATTFPPESLPPASISSRSRWLPRPQARRPPQPAC